MKKYSIKYNMNKPMINSFLYEAMDISDLGTYRFGNWIAGIHDDVMKFAFVPKSIIEVDCTDFPLINYGSNQQVNATSMKPVWSDRDRGEIYLIDGISFFVDTEGQMFDPSNRRDESHWITGTGVHIPDALKQDGIAEYRYCKETKSIVDCTGTYVQCGDANGVIDKLNQIAEPFVVTTEAGRHLVEYGDFLSGWPDITKSLGDHPYKMIIERYGRTEIIFNSKQLNEVKASMVQPITVTYGKEALTTCNWFLDDLLTGIEEYKCHSDRMGWVFIESSGDSPCRARGRYYPSVNLAIQDAHDRGLGEAKMNGNYRVYYNAYGSPLMMTSGGWTASGVVWPSLDIAMQQGGYYFTSSPLITLMQNGSLGDDDVKVIHIEKNRSRIIDGDDVMDEGYTSAMLTEAYKLGLSINKIGVTS